MPKPVDRSTTMSRGSCQSQPRFDRNELQINRSRGWILLTQGNAQKRLKAWEGLDHSGFNQIKLMLTHLDPCLAKIGVATEARFERYGLILSLSRKAKAEGAEALWLYTLYRQFIPEFVKTTPPEIWRDHAKLQKCLGAIFRLGVKAVDEKMSPIALFDKALPAFFDRCPDEVWENPEKIKVYLKLIFDLGVTASKRGHYADTLYAWELSPFLEKCSEKTLQDPKRLKLIFDLAIEALEKGIDVNKFLNEIALKCPDKLLEDHRTLQEHIRAQIETNTPPPPPSHSSDPATLEHFIANKIERSSLGRIPFSNFMEMALYTPVTEHEKGGYFTSLHSIHDFHTNPMIYSPHFGRAVGEKIGQYWETMGSPRSFAIVIMGEGDGTLARDILDHIKSSLPDLYAKLKTHIVEISPSLCGRQRKTLKDHLGSITWHNQSAISDPLPEIEGVFISSELPDTFPVHLVSKDESGSLREAWIKPEIISPQWQEFKFSWVSEVSPEIRQYLELARKSVIPDLTIPVNLNALEWMKNVTRSLKKGYHVVFDIGFSGRIYPIDMPLITSYDLILNRIGFGSGSPLMKPGQRDIFSMVDFDILQKAGEEAGASTVLKDLEEHFFTGTSWTYPHHPESRSSSVIKTGVLTLVQSKL